MQRNPNHSLDDLWIRLRNIAQTEYGDIVERADLLLSPAGRIRKLRLYIFDGSFVDVWISGRGDYSFHWERKHIDGLFYRHDNAPHIRWRDVPTFPKHFHDGQDNVVRESRIAETPEEALRDVLTEIRTKMAAMSRRPPWS
ncbi:MAG: DUF6516 family protein [Anaerolineae bacterium]|nr:DUF6516 family protein [Anaerolineae bacterium]